MQHQALRSYHPNTNTRSNHQKRTKLEGLPVITSWLWNGVFLLFSNFIAASSIFCGANETLGANFGLVFSVSNCLTYGVSLLSATSSVSTNDTLDGRRSSFTNGVSLLTIWVGATADVPMRREGRSSSSFSMGSWPASIRRISASAWVIRRFLLVNLAAGAIFCLEV